MPTVGVFLNDGSGAKLGYYLRPSATLAVGDCRPDGRRELRLRVTLRSSAPKSGLSESVLGLGLAGDPYTVRMVSVHSPPAGGARRPSGRRRDGGGQRHRTAPQVSTANVEVGPGGSRTLEVTVLTATTGVGTAELWLTPTATPWTTQVVSAPSCDQ